MRCKPLLAGASGLKSSFRTMYVTRHVAGMVKVNIEGEHRDSASAGQTSETAYPPRLHMPSRLGVPPVSPSAVAHAESCLPVWT
jgi:hypothetical protein